MIFRKKSIRKPILFTLLLSSNAVLSADNIKSPAHNLLEQTIDLLEKYYFGFQNVDFEAFGKMYLRRLDNDCTSYGKDCPYDVAEPLAQEMVWDIGDRHTYYLPKDAFFENLMKQSNGEKTKSLGFTTLTDSERKLLVVDYVHPDIPMNESSLKRGDSIISFNNQKISSFKFVRQAVSELFSLSDSKKPIKLQIKRQNKTISMELNPQNLDPWLPRMEFIDQNTAKIDVYQLFTEGKVAQRFHDLIKKANDANTNSLILDLRSCSGGLVTETIAITGVFLERAIFNAKNKVGNFHLRYENGSIFIKPVSREEVEYLKINNPQTWNKKVVVLVGQNTVSGCEYIAYRLQKDGFKVIGWQTNGVMNTAHEFMELINGSKLVITTFRTIDEQGEYLPELVTPDVEIKTDPYQLYLGKDLPLNAAINLLK